MATPKEVRERIKELFPGDENGPLRHSLYSTPNLLSSSPTDDQIQMAAVDAITPVPGSAPSLPQENNGTKQGEILDADQAYHGALALVTPPAPMVVKTPEDYELASRFFGGIKKALAELEAERVRQKAPLLQAERDLDAKYKIPSDMLNTALSFVEPPMKAFKMAELETQRQAAMVRDKAIQDARAAAHAEVDAARDRLAAAHRVAEEEVDPFLAALAQEDIVAAQVETRQALVAVATAPSRVSLPSAIAPVVATGSKTTYRWDWEFFDESLVERSLCDPSTRKINAHVKNLKLQSGSDLSKIAQPLGIRIFENVSLGAKP
jgi:hypothetical protein